MPKLAITMEEGRILAWLKREGEKILKGEPLVEIETDKATAELESPCSGYLKKIVVSDGQTAPVESLLAYIATDEEELKVDVEAWLKASAGGFTDDAIPAIDSDSTLLQPQLAKGRQEVRAAPAARKLVRELGIDLTQVKGSGPGGRITPEDVRNAAGAQIERADDVLRNRKPIITNLTKSLNTIPHINICKEVIAERLVAFKKEAGGATYTEILVKALAITINEYPVFKMAMVGDRLYRGETTDVGFVVDTDAGLFIPVVREAHLRSLQEVSSEVRELTAKTRDGRLEPTDLEGATISLSNLGMYGVDFFTAIIPYGQVAILAMGRIRDGASSGREAVPTPRFWLNLVVDHRLIDGVLAAKFMRSLSELLESETVFGLL